MDRIRLPRSNTRPAPRRTPPRRGEPPDALAEAITNMGQLGEFVHTIRTRLSIGQAELARRADVGRHWLGELEQGKPTLEVQMVLRVLLTLGFEIVLAPYDPPPPWMLRACGAAIEKRKATAAAARVRRTTRRALARERRLAENEPGGRVFLE